MDREQCRAHFIEKLTTGFPGIEIAIVDQFYGLSNWWYRADVNEIPQTLDAEFDRTIQDLRDVLGMPNNIELICHLQWRPDENSGFYCGSIHIRTPVFPKAELNIACSYF
jgi:hypothetical protein